MKKSLVVTLALVFVLGIAGTAFAASNPFVDVPANHWSYDAITKLAHDGVIDGYGDGTFRGGQNITRYEAAQIVAKALAKSDKASAEDKALIDKLAVEFNAELQNLGVRVAKLEANQSKVKFGGTLDIRYRAIDYDNGSNGTNSFYRLRLNGTAAVDDKTSVGFRFVTNGQDNTDLRNNTWQGAGSTSNGKSQIDRAFVNTKIGAVDTTIGRQALKIDPFNQIIDSGAFSFDAVKFSTKAGAFTFTGQYGRFAKDATVKGVGNYGTIDVGGFDIASNIGKLSYSLNATQFKDNGSSTYAGKGDLAKYYFANAGYKFDNKWFLGGQYGTNDVDNAWGTAGREGNDFGAVRLVYGTLAPAAKGQSNITVQYSKQGANTISPAFTTLDTPWSPNTAYYYDGFKVLDFNYNYAFSKNLLGQLQYVKVDDSDNDYPNYDYFKATLTAKF